MRTQKGDLGCVQAEYGEERLSAISVTIGNRAIRPFFSVY